MPGRTNEGDWENGGNASVNERAELHDHDAGTLLNSHVSALARGLFVGLLGTVGEASRRRSAIGATPMRFQSSLTRREDFSLLFSVG